MTDFAIRKAGSVMVVDWPNNGMRPASPEEIQLWEEADGLRAEVEALREDAERYRWLRETSANGWSNGDDYEPVLVFVTTADSKSWREELDAAIDAAREDV